MVHDPGMNPNWEGSTDDNKTGFISSSMTKLSATLDKVEVKEIGLRSLLVSLTVGAFGRGGTSAIFQALGTLHLEKEELRISATGAARIYYYITVFIILLYFAYITYNARLYWFEK